MDCSLPGSSVHGNSPGKNAGVGYHALLHGNLPDPGIEPMSPAAPALQADSLPQSHRGSLFLFGFALTEMKEFPFMLEHLGAVGVCDSLPPRKGPRAAHPKRQFTGASAGW